MANGWLPRAARWAPAENSRLVSLALLLTLASVVDAARSDGLGAKGPLPVHLENPRYFTDATRGPDGSLRAVYLTGSQTWDNLVDRGRSDPPEPFDFPATLDKAPLAADAVLIQSEVKWGAIIIGASHHVISNSGECDWLVVDGFEVMGGRYDGIKMNGDHNLCLPESGAQGTPGVSSDPRFIDPTRGVFCLRANTPAVAAGSADHAPARDFWGRSRSKDHAPDLGAFPYVRELEKQETRAEWDHGWAYHRHGANMNVLPDLWRHP
jgi:hypothetical protein